jgi:hypothetical protein
MSAIGPKRTSVVAPHMSAFGGKADIALTPHFSWRRGRCMAGRRAGAQVATIGCAQRTVGYAWST